MKKAEQAARLLCRLGERYLWTPRIAWARMQSPGINLYFRVGSGRKTYHQSRGDAHSITIGSKCVADTFSSSRRASLWLSYREIVEREYFGGCPEPAELLVHSLCHEFAHFVQTFLARRVKGQQHNAAFYQILDRIHHGGHAAQLLDQFREECNQLGFSLEFEQDTPALLNYEPGDKVLARAADRIFAGRIVARNRKSVVVGVTENGISHRIRVKPEWIEPDTASLATERSEF